jgi:hypothetical protein
MARPQSEIADAERNKRSGVSRPAHEPIDVHHQPMPRRPSFWAPGPHAFAPPPGGLRRSAKKSEIAYAERNKRSGVSRPAHEPIDVHNEPRSRRPSFSAPGPHAFAPLPGGLRRSAKNAFTPQGPLCRFFGIFQQKNRLAAPEWTWTFGKRDKHHCLKLGHRHDAQLSSTTARSIGIPRESLQVLALQASRRWP